MDSFSQQEEPNAGPRLVTRTELEPSEARPRMRSRWVVAPSAEGWTDVVVSEWELHAAGWFDRHPHSETNLVLEGELHVECAGVTVVASTGDSVTVPAGGLGRYWAPDHARMLAVYGPNPDAAETTEYGYWEL